MTTIMSMNLPELQAYAKTLEEKNLENQEALETATTTQKTLDRLAQSIGEEKKELETRMVDWVEELPGEGTFYEKAGVLNELVKILSEEEMTPEGFVGKMNNLIKKKTDLENTVAFYKNVTKIVGVMGSLALLLTYAYSFRGSSTFSWKNCKVW